MTKIIIYGISKEIKKYTFEFMDKVDYIVEANAHESGYIYGKK